MVLNPILESVDELPDPLKEHYRQSEDGRFILDVKPSDGFALENVAGLKSTLAKYKERVPQLEAKLQAFGDLDPDAAREALEKLDEVQNWTPDDKVREKLTSLEKQLRDKFGKEVAAAQERETKMRSVVDEMVRRSQIMSAVAKHKGNPDLLVPVVERMTKTVEENGKWEARVIDESGETYRISQKSGAGEGWMSVDEYVESLRNDRRYMGAFDGTDASGSGSGNANGRHRSGGIPDNVSGMERVRLARQAGRT